MTRAALALAEIAFGVALVCAATGHRAVAALAGTIAAACAFTVLHQLIHRGDRP